MPSTVLGSGSDFRVESHRMNREMNYARQVQVVLLSIARQ